MLLLCSNMVLNTAISLLLPLLFLVSTAIAKTVTYDFNVGWVTAQPDGFSRPTIGINGQWPIPPITAAVGDKVVVHVQNDLGNQSTSLHFHGLYQNGTAHMDGPVGVSQCSIPIGGSFVYEFQVSIFCHFVARMFSVLSDRSAWYLLVPLARLWPVSRRSPWTPDHQRSGLSIQRPVR